ncbi:Putative ribonuclease H protein At1g65750, partial [Linum grandiflorum]
LNHLESIPSDYITAGPAYISWPLESSGCFSVKSLRTAISSQRFMGCGNFPAEVVWIHYVPSKIQCFAWKVYHQKIATTDNLQQRGFHLAGRCVLCSKQSESVNHLFLQCEFASGIWRRFSSVLSIHGPFHNEMTDFMWGWKGMNCISRFKCATEVLLHAFLWCIWTERNHRTFREEFCSPTQILFKMVRLIGLWRQSWGLLAGSVLTDWHHLNIENG